MKTLLTVLVVLGMAGIVWAWDGICPECKKAKQKSTVVCLGGTSTLMATQSYYDEEGNFHYHNPNITTMQYECSRGHRFITKNGEIPEPQKKDSLNFKARPQSHPLWVDTLTMRRTR